MPWISKKASLVFLVVYSSLFILVTACSESSEDSSKTQKQVIEQPQEDDLLLRLSAEMSADTGLVAQERNAILETAIDKMRNIHPTNSGLFYEIIEVGSGDAINWGDYLKVHYKGNFLNGRQFANSRQNDRPLEFYVGNMIDAWNEGIQLVNVGSKIHLYAPSRLAYGSEGLQKKNGDFIVPPNQVLKFEIEVLEKLDQE